MSVALVLFALTCVPAAEGQRDASFRSVWADAYHSGFKTSSQVNDLVARAVAGNYNAIIAEVLAYHDTGSGGHGAYWNSALVPKASDVSSSYDPLAYLVSQAHIAGIEVHAWIVPYRVCTSWPPSGNTLLINHPEWTMVSIDDMGNGPAPIGPAGQAKYFLDPGSPDAQEYIVGIVRELVTDYAVDGINFDYIRYTQVDAGYPADENYAGSTLARFRDLTWYQGTPPPEGISSWNDFRRRTINELVRRCRAEIPAITSNPQQPVRLTADLITFGDAPSNFTSSSAYQLHQNWPYWMEQGWLDAGIPMNYKREHVSNEAQWYRNWVDVALYWRYARHVFCGQGNYLNSMANSVTQLQYSLGQGADGTCNYSYYYTADENLNGTPEANWSWYTYVASNLFTTPVPTPAMPWRHPDTAVEGTLWGRVFDPASGAPIDGAMITLSGVPSVETDGNGYYVVTMVPADPGGTAYDITANKIGCPQEIITGVVVYPGEVARQDIHLCDSWVAGDMNGDGQVDADDLPLFLFCLQGPGYPYVEGHVCLNGDMDGNMTIDLADVAGFQSAFGGP